MHTSDGELDLTLTREHPKASPIGSRVLWRSQASDASCATLKLAKMPGIDLRAARPDCDPASPLQSSESDTAGDYLTRGTVTPICRSEGAGSAKYALRRHLGSE